MCLFCCVKLRGASYFMATCHCVGCFFLAIISVLLIIHPPEYPNINLSPLIMSQLPLIAASYMFLSSLFACFIFRAIDMDSVFLLKWSVLGFGVYQALVICVQVVFSVMFGDILTPGGQIGFAIIILANFLLSVLYLIILFLHGRHLAEMKKQSISNGNNGGNGKLYAKKPQEQAELFNNWALYSKDLQIPGLNFLQNHPPITRTNSVATNTEADENSLNEAIDDCSDNPSV